MGKPLFKASDGDGLSVWEDLTERELQRVSGMQVFI
jgi:hypothetical protein